MAQTDIYCGLCGAALSIPLFRATDAQDESGPGDGVPRIEDMNWLEDVRILYRSIYVAMSFRRYVQVQNIFIYDKFNELPTYKFPRRVNLSSIVSRHDDDGMWEATGYLPDDDEFENINPDTYTLFEPYVLIDSNQRR
jgi:hypothetical protein